MKRTPAQSAENLLKAIEDAKLKREYNFVKDLEMLLKAYPKTSKRDYLALIRALIDKYNVEESAEVHAALLRKCQAGDIEAIRLWNDMQKEGGSGVAEVNIIDNF